MIRLKGNAGTGNVMNAVRHALARLLRDTQAQNHARRRDLHLCVGNLQL